MTKKEEEHEIYSIDNNMKKKFLEAVNEHGTIRTMKFFVGYPPRWVSVKTEDLCQAILKDVEELEEKPIEAYEKRLTESNETVSRLLKTNKDYENTIDKLQQVIVAQATQLLDVHTENKKMKEYIEKLLKDAEDPKQA